MTYCPECDTAVPDRERFCDSCGADLTVTESQSERGHTSEGYSPSRGESTHDGHQPPGHGPLGASSGVPVTDNRLLVWAAMAVGGLVLLRSVVLSAFGIVLFVTPPFQVKTVVLSVIVLLESLIWPLLALGVSGYYYRWGYLTRRYFGALAVIGVGGLFLGPGTLLVVLVPIALYGYFVVLD